MNHLFPPGARDEYLVVGQIHLFAGGCQSMIPLLSGLSKIIAISEVWYEISRIGDICGCPVDYDSGLGSQVSADPEHR
jgi:hypothetical protein